MAFIRGFAMKTQYKTRTSTPLTRVLSNTPLLAGLAGSLAVLAAYSLVRQSQKGKRYSDHAAERRLPANMFAAGIHPRRRSIDVSGRKPVFERRQSAYEMS